ncbi:hypothetical protein ACFU99_14785 [Streptomyces sp. NPDC057654]|uniref:hypothetical protein n=1 Tax=Streptomyces sp. NPDC057654 TaxID=3346196 RepID=UPI0036A7D982
MSESPTSTDPATGTDPAADPANAPAPAVAPAPTTPAVDPAAEQQLADATKRAEQAAAERDDALAALRRVLDPSGAAAEQDPAQFAEQAAGERDAALAEARRLRVELAAHQAAHQGGADPARLLDSRTVEKQLADLDPADDKFGDKLAAVITAAVEAAPHLRSAPAGPARGGADFTASGTPGVTPQQFAAMDYSARAALFQSDPETYRRLNAGDQ